MANPTTNYSFAMPTNTDLVKDLPADFEVFGQAVDTQMKTNADAAIAKSLVTTKGDIIAATGASTPARLAVGTDGQVLTADAASASGVKWATSSSGGMTLLSTTTLSGATTTISSISGNYKSLVLYIRNFLPATDNQELRMRINGDSNLRYVNFTYQTANGTADAFDNSSSWTLTQGADNAVTQSFCFVQIYDYANTATWKMGQTAAINNGNTTTTQVKNNLYLQGYNQTGAITSLTFFCNTGNITSGTVLLYGVS